MSEIYSSLKQERDKEEIKKRDDQVNLARLRARMHPALGEYKLKSMQPLMLMSPL